MSSNPTVGIPALCWIRNPHSLWRPTRPTNGLAISLPCADRGTVAPTSMPHFPDQLEAQKLPGAPSWTRYPLFWSPRWAHTPPGILCREGQLCTVYFPCSIFHHNIIAVSKLKVCEHYNHVSVYFCLKQNSVIHRCLKQIRIHNLLLFFLPEYVRELLNAGSVQPKQS